MREFKLRNKAKFLLFLFPFGFLRGALATPLSAQSKTTTSSPPVAPKPAERPPSAPAGVPPAPMPEKLPPYHFVGSLALGLLAVPEINSVAPDLRLDFGFSCNTSSFCNRYQIQFLRAYLSLSPANDPFWESTSGLTPEHHFPFAKGILEPLELALTPRIHLMVGRFEFLRAVRTLEQSANIQENLATLRIPFAEKTVPATQGACFFDVAGPGLKYVEYARQGNVPFWGLSVVGVRQGCHYELGNSKFAIEIGYTLRSGVSIGQSGNGTETPKSAGGFGAVVSEYRLEVHTGLRISLPENAVKYGIFSIHLLGFFEAGYHLDQGCLQSSDNATLACSNNLTSHEIRVGAMVSVDFGFPDLVKRPKLPLPSAFSLAL